MLKGLFVCHGMVTNIEKFFDRLIIVVEGFLNCATSCCIIHMKDKSATGCGTNDYNISVRGK